MRSGFESVLESILLGCSVPVCFSHFPELAAAVESKRRDSNHPDRIYQQE